MGKHEKIIKPNFLAKIIRSVHVEIFTKQLNLNLSIVILSFLCGGIIKLNLAYGLISILLLMIVSIKFGAKYYDNILELKEELSGLQALFVEYKKQELHSRFANWQVK